VATLVELRSRIRDTANIDSNRISDTRLNEIINDAIAEISSSSRLAFSEKSIPVTIVAGTTDYQPVDAEGPLERPILWWYTHPTFGGIREIKQSTLEGVRTAVGTDPDSVITGIPQVYTIWGWANDMPILKIWPTPAEDLVTTLDCRIRFTAMTLDAQYNDVTVSASDAVVYLALLLSAPYMENDDRMDTWDRMYSRSIKRIRQAHSSARYSGSARRSMKEPG
jgi:hypothetical protein